MLRIFFIILELLVLFLIHEYRVNKKREDVFLNQMLDHVDNLVQEMETNAINKIETDIMKFLSNQTSNFDSLSM